MQTSQADIFDHLVTVFFESRLRGLFFRWRLNAIRSNACNLVVMGADVGHQKTQDMHRSASLRGWMCENVIWDGFPDSPLSGCYSLRRQISFNSSRSVQGLSEALEV